ncbi:hypothetical protein BCR33DRAFT_723479, partial [Rhizoclosmatium globosum]
MSVTYTPYLSPHPLLSSQFSTLFDSSNAKVIHLVFVQAGWRVTSQVRLDPWQCSIAVVTLLHSGSLADCDMSDSWEIYFPCEQ